MAMRKVLFDECSVLGTAGHQMKLLHFSQSILGLFSSHSSSGMPGLFSRNLTRLVDFNLKANVFLLLVAKVE